jgi:hypothetical protein
LPGAPAGSTNVVIAGTLAAPFSVTNPSAQLTEQGIEFGPYVTPNGGGAGGSLCYAGLNGLTLGSVAHLSYTARYSTDDNTTVGVPYLRIFTESASPDHDVIFSPNTQQDPAVSENTFHHWVVTSGTVRYDDDPGNGADQPWAAVQTAHASDIITDVCVTTGFSGGENLSAILRKLDVQTVGTDPVHFTFGS